MENVQIPLIRCINFAAIKHKNQRRKDPENTPYINHPIGVANILVEEGGIDDLATLQAAILHDTVEDTDTTLVEIEREFGSEIKCIVAELTDDKLLAKEERKRQQIARAPQCSYKAKLVKLADKLYNLRDLNRTIPQGWTDDRVHEYFVWASKVVSGLKGTNENLEKLLRNLFERRNVEF
ncbi:HDDC3 (predicted) [Pycnogonum litorale]